MTSSVKTLLEIVQDILSDMDGDEVNSISDTAESEQVASIVEKTYQNMMSNSVWPHTRRATALTPYSDSTKPTHMYLNDDVKELISVYYNVIKQGETRKSYQKIDYLEPDRFLQKINVRNNTKTNVDIITDPSGIELMILNDTAPKYYTSFDDVTLVFDAYDSEVDSTLQESKFQALGYIMPSFRKEDSFTPDLPPDAFSYLVEEATSRAQMKLREVQDVKSETESIKQGRWLSRKSWRTNGGIRFPNYGKTK
jgi:hypothetical protein